MTMVRFFAFFFLASLVAAQRQRPSREQQREFSQCLLQGNTREQCRGENSGPVDEVAERLEAERGAPAAIAEQMKNCTQEGQGTTEDFEACKNRTLESLQRLRNGTVDGEDVNRMLEKAAEEAGRAIIRRCLAAATTDAAKEACYSSEEAKREMAAISGRQPNDFDADDIKDALRDGAAQDVKDEIKNCRANAADDAAKRECMKPTDALRDEIASSSGKKREDVKDSDVREFLEEGALEDMWSIMKTCTGDRQACLASAKEKLGEITGETGLSDDAIAKRLDDAMKEDLAANMATCTKSAADEAARKRCRETVADAALSTADGSAHSKGDRNLALQEAGEAAAKQVLKECTGTREVCMQRLREKAAESTGRLASELTDVELERLNEEGSKDAAKDAMKACISAKKDNAAATCDDFYSVYESGRGTGTMDAAEKRRLQKEIAEDLEKEDFLLCLKSADRTAYEACMANLPESDELQDELFKDLDAQVKENRKKRAKGEAAVDALGEMFRACMEEAETTAEQEACKTEMKANREKAGVMEDDDDVIMKYQRNKLGASARACSSTQRSECISQAKEELIKMGLKRRAFGIIKKLADLKEAAEAWAECQEASTTADDPACVTLAQTTLEELSGQTGIWTEETIAKVQDLATAFMEGREVVLRTLKQVLVEAISSASTCSDAFLDRIINKVMTISNNFTVPGSPDANRSVEDKRCLVTFGKARYFCRVKTEDMDETETMQLSDDIADELTTADLSRRLFFKRSRRLQSETITETYADQEVEEGSNITTTTTSGASTSSSGTPDDTTTTSGLPDPDDTTTTGTPEASAAGSIVAGCTLGLAMSFLSLSML